MSLCSCDPDKEYNLDCFEHRSRNKLRVRLKELEEENTFLKENMGWAPHIRAIVAYICVAAVFIALAGTK